MSKPNKKLDKQSKPTAFDSQREFLLETLEPRMLLSADGLLPPDVLESFQEEGIVEEWVADETLLAATHFQLKEEDGQIQVLDTDDLSDVPVIAPETEAMIEVLQEPLKETDELQPEEREEQEPQSELQVNLTTGTQTFSGFSQRIQGHEIIIIDSRVADIEQLLTHTSTSVSDSHSDDVSTQSDEDYQPTTESSAISNDWHIVDLTQADALLQPLPDAGQRIAYIIDAQQDGIEQVSEILSQYENLDAVHILSHGASGALFLGAGRITASTLQQESRKVQRWGNALSADGDILLYGCNIAAGNDGEKLVQELARLTQADIAASSDATGDAEQGGNWSLEVSTGDIEQSLKVDNYQTLLLDTTSTTGVAKVQAADLTGTGTTSETLDTSIIELNLSNIAAELTITLKANGSISIESGSKTITYTREGNGVLDDLVLGKGNNTLIFESTANLSGQLSAPASTGQLTIVYQGSDGSGGHTRLSDANNINLPRVGDVASSIKTTSIASITDGDINDNFDGSDDGYNYIGGKGKDCIYS